MPSGRARRRGRPAACPGRRTPASSSGSASACGGAGGSLRRAWAWPGCGRRPRSVPRSAAAVGCDRAAARTGPATVVPRERATARRMVPASARAPGSSDERRGRRVSGSRPERSAPGSGWRRPGAVGAVTRDCGPGRRDGARSPGSEPAQTNPYAERDRGQDEVDDAKGEHEAEALRTGHVGSSAPPKLQAAGVQRPPRRGW